MSHDLPIESYLRDTEILHQTAEQIKKEFSFFALDIHVTGDQSNAYRELFDQIYPHIERLMKQEHERFLGLLYRIDINELLIGKCPADQRLEEYVTDLVIKRCLQKVNLRKLYS